YPAPNLPGSVNNYASNQATTNNADELDTRFDQQIAARDMAFFRYSRGTGEKDLSSVFAPPGNGGATGQFPVDVPVNAWSMAMSETHIFTSALVNEIHAGYTHNSSNQLSPAPEPLFGQFGFSSIPALAGITGLPSLNMGAFSSLGNKTFTPNLKSVQLAQLNDTVSWNHGNHDVRFGVEFKDTHNFADSANMPRGSFTFTGQFTSKTPGQGKGSELADLLLGQTATAGLGTFQVMHLRNHYYGLFVNDSWKVTPRLTVNLGLRYELQTPWWERDNAQTNFDVDPRSPAYGTLVPAQSGSYLNRTFVNLEKTNFAPRAGLAYRIGANTVLRGAFGIFYGFPGYTGNNDSGTANPPYLVNVVQTSPTTAAVSSVPLAAGFSAGLLNPVNLNNPNVYSISTIFPMPVVDQWNFSVQRQLGSGNSVTLSYVGSSSSDLSGLTDLNAPVPGPGAVNPRRPFPAWGQVEYETPYAHATYHGLQASFERRFRKGLSVIANYTWSHSLDNVLNHEDNVGGSFPQNPNDAAAEKADSGYDIRHRFVTSVIYELPVGRAGGFLGGSRAMRWIAGGWQTGSIVVAQAGYPITPTVSPNPANTTTPARPNRVCDGNLDAAKRTVDAWFQVSCFQPATPFLFGNSARDVIRAPGLVNLDFLAQRNFHFTEERYVEFRAEFFNLTNSAHFGAPNAAIANAQAGRITSTAAPNREIEFGVKIWF
ncbi:MAG: TonB-dependent receptor, partial [Bryobacteraceae bacterium]